MTERICRLCKFWSTEYSEDDGDDDSELRHSGRCHRFPPVWNGQAVPEQHIWRAFDQPGTLSGDWCGEFQERPSNAEQAEP